MLALNRLASIQWKSHRCECIRILIAVSLQLISMQSDATATEKATALLEHQALEVSGSLEQISKSTEPNITLLYTGRLQGEIEPCGCTAYSDFGGLRRLATVVDELRRSTPELQLYGTGGQLSTLLPAHQISNKFLLEGLHLLDYNAIGLHWDDLLYGVDFSNAVELPWVASNWKSDEYKDARTTTQSGLTVAYFAWMANELSPYKLLPLKQRKTTQDYERLVEQLLKLQQTDILTIVGTHGLSAPLESLPLNLIDVLILPLDVEKFGQPEWIGSTLVLRPGSRGQFVGHLTLGVSTSRAIELISHRAIPLDASIPDATRLDNWYARYTDALTLDYQVRKAASLASGGSGDFSGAESCEGCHDQQLSQWQYTEHAHALRSLQAVNKQYDANCLVCHTVGFGEKGGFPTAEAGPNMDNVACETCHGPSRLHVLSAGAKATHAVNPATCIQCHNDSHSPTFDVLTYWPKILH